MRSWLFVPGDSDRKISKALSGEADIVILDLEDSVARDNKSAARSIVADTLASVVASVVANKPETGCQIFVRVNALDSGFTKADLEALSDTPPDGYMLPKTNSGKDVEHFAKLANTQLPIIAIATETAASLFNLGTYGDIAAPLSAMTWGAEDLSSELGAHHSRNEDGHLTDPYRLARSLCLAGARAAQVEPIDSIYANFRDMAGLERKCHAGVRDGFSGKMAIHPDQIPLINKIFTPSLEAIDQARQIVDAFARSENAGVISLNGQMYDLPHLKRAEKLLKRASLYRADD